VSGSHTLAEAGGQTPVGMSDTPRRSPGGAHRAVQGCSRQADGRVRSGRGYRQAARVRRPVAGRPQASRPAGLMARGANRSARSQPKAQYHEANRTHPVCEPELNSLSIYEALMTLISPFSPATSSCSQPLVSHYLAAYAILPRAILTVILVVLHIRICDARLPAGAGGRD
jgi:hypothetical protein